MNESATIDRRQRRMVETASRLTAISRRLTAQHGLGGFTIEELCDEVGVSRRTFFNYFPTKEDAVIGADPETESQVFAEQFLAKGSRGWPVVVDDLLELAIQHFGALEGTAREHADFFAALDREPRLLKRFIGMTIERERQVAAIVAEREGVPSDDPRAQAVVYILFGLLRSVGDRLHGLAAPSDLTSILTESLAAARIVMAAPTPDRKAHP
jgi:AcrR family transcriptional regulator